MNLYIINSEIPNTLAQYLLKHLIPYNGEVCDIVEIICTDDITFKGYLDKLTIGKLKHQLTKKIDYYIKKDLYGVIYYLVQTQQINYKDIIDKICQYNRYKSLQVLIDQGINVNIQNNYRNTPLHYACSFNRVESVQSLLNNGANVNIQDIIGWTPLHYACRNNNFETVKLLLDNGANVNIPDDEGWIPLQIAQNNNNTECIRLLSSLQNL